MNTVRRGEVVQREAWGSIPKADRDFLTSIGVSPKTECNAHHNPMR